MKNIYIFITISLFCLNQTVKSQTDSTFKIIPVSLSQFLKDVAKGNLNYIAEQLNVNIANASYKAAKVFQDPEISINYAAGVDPNMLMGNSIETGISFSISSGNRRGANMSLAKSQYELSQISLDAFFQNLKSNAILGYFEALKQKKIHLLNLNTYEQLLKLAKTDSIRFVVGEANEIDALQSALEAKTWYNVISQSKVDEQNAFTTMIYLMGKSMKDTLFIPSDDFFMHTVDFQLKDLIQNAIKKRFDILIAIKNKEISEKNLRILKANRAFEFNLQAGYAINSEVKNELAPAPAFNGYSLGIAIPLKFSNINRSTVKAAKYEIQKTEFLCKDIELQITTEVITAYNNYVAQKKQIEQFDKDMIKNAEKILNGRIYSYQRGESGLLDVLNAQRTYNELRKTYIETQFNYIISLFELEKIAAIEDILIK